MSIGGKVRQYRYVKHLSQSDLAEKAGVSQSAISSLESDKSIPGSLMLHQIADALEVDMNDLLKDGNIVQNNSNRATGTVYSNIRNQTINNQFTESILEILLSNQEKITNLIEMQNKLVEKLLKKGLIDFP